MSNSYKKIMDKVEVTDEMSERVIKNIERINSKSNIYGKSSFKNLISVAACFVAVIGLLIYWNNYKKPVNQRPPVTTQQGNSGIVTVNSLDELSKLVGFNVAKLTEIPFDVQKIEYFDYRGLLAEIRYSSSEDIIIFRQAEGKDDISGDYKEYKLIEKTDINSLSITLKGDSEDEYNLIIWCDDKYSYSIRSKSHLSKTQVKELIKNIK